METAQKLPFSIDGSTIVIELLNREFFFYAKWMNFFLEKYFTFFIPPNVGDIIDLLSFLEENNAENLEFKKEFLETFSTKYVKVITRIHTTKQCTLQVEAFKL
nr:hypothetical protein [Elizabethkingia sp. ASV34]